MNVLAIIPARAGSVGVPGKNIRKLLGKPVINYTIETAQKATLINRIVVSSDSPEVIDICQRMHIDFIDRPAELATSNAQIDDVMRHCLAELESQNGDHTDAVALLYANVPVRADDIIDRAIELLTTSGADSVQTVAPVGKFHPSWLYQLNGDRASKYIDNKIYRRQDLDPLYYIDGAVGVVTRQSLLAGQDNPDPHAFWGPDRRVIIQDPHETVDIDSVRDFYMAEAALREKE
ncbi:MAG: acylneuraminate cytidylyltransferase family protein [Phycisphaerae bacterium]|nr:acylneuraminate cytidylyltransferase family protein [Phycisphaerae bacterium]